VSLSSLGAVAVTTPSWGLFLLAETAEALHDHVANLGVSGVFECLIGGICREVYKGQYPTVNSFMTITSFHKHPKTKANRFVSSLNYSQKHTNMLSYSVLLTSLLSIGSVFALPPSLEKRSCSYKYQPSLNTIVQHQPTSSAPTTTTPFTVWNEIGKKDILASFRYLPSGAYGCQLEFDYKPGHNPIVSKQVGDPTVINVYRVSDGGNFPYPPTWDNTAPRTGALVGTFHFPSGNDLNKASVKVINSFTCDAIMTFRFSVADPNARGGVRDDEDLTSGLRISYNC
jgi:hypothetical protein